MRVAVLGTGLIGGSIGLALTGSGHEVVAYDRDEATARAAVERGAARRAAPTPAAAVEDAEMVFVATPVSSIAGLVASCANSLVSGAMITDVGSTKSRVVREVEASLPAGIHFIGGHPMAGSEDEGISAARANLFQGAWWILTPTERAETDAYRAVHAVLTTMGARVMALHPSEHDELMALISHLPQLVATTLMNMAAARGADHAGLLALAAGGFRDVTRVAASNPAVWLDICRENGEAIASCLRGFADALVDAAADLEGGRFDAIESALVAGREARRSLPGKAVEGDAYEVRMSVPDRPGVLAEVTTSVGNLGINIEDLQISHSAEGGRGVLHLTIGGAAPADRVAQILRSQGFDAKAVEL